jgi:coenzyme F420 hydrogenase subunit beta
VSARADGVRDGGTVDAVIQALLVAAYSSRLIDGVVALDLDPWTLEPCVRIATSVEEIVDWLSVPHLWAPVLSSLNEAIFERQLRGLAIVGPPCVAEGARRLRESDHPRLWPYHDAIRLTVAPFCTGALLPEVVPDLLERGMGIARETIQGLRTSAADGTLTIALRDGTQRTIPLTEVEPYTRKGCGRCDDYLGQSADIAVGDVGALPGHSTLICRSTVGRGVLQHAEMLGLVKTEPTVDVEELQVAQAQKDRRQRAQAFDQFQILMLDALSDPKKRADVRRQFTNLYGATPKKVPAKEESHVNRNR